MPRRDPELPEGTDQSSAAPPNRRRRPRSGGFVATATTAARRPTGWSTRSAIRSRPCAARPASRVRGFADDGKGRATGLLDDFSGVIADAAKSIDERLGEDYGGYAHRAADAVSGFAGKVRDKTVDDIVDDARDFVRKSPAVAIGIAAVAGFALVRVLKTGLDDVGARGRRRQARRQRSLILDAPGGESAGASRSATCSAASSRTAAPMPRPSSSSIKAIARYRALRARKAGLVALAARLVPADLGADAR